MMKVTYRLKLGQDEFELQAEVKDEKDFFEQMSFYSNLPKAAPGGATDLKLVFRTTKKGHKYYSLISDSEKMEFKLGQNLEANGGGLFPKGWETAFGADEDGESQAPVNQNASPITMGQQAKPAAKAQAAPPIQAPIQPPVTQAFAAPPVAAAAPVMPTPMAAPAPIPAPIQQAAPLVQPAAPAPPAAPAQNPQVTAVANNVLARFGINK